MTYPIVNVLDLVETIGEEQVQSILSDFSCPKNQEIEDFVHWNALDFAKRKMSITYGIFDDDGNLAAIFSLTHKAVEIGNTNLSSSTKRKIERYAQLDEASNMYTVSAFLIAQFGKNYAVSSKSLTGNQMMDCAFDILTRVQHEIGGGVVYLECEDKEKLLSFYQNDQNRFKPFGKRFSSVENVDYIQLFRFF